MTPGAYLKDRLIDVALVALAALGVGAMLALLGDGWDAALAGAALVAGCGALALAVGYARRRRFYRELARCVEELDKTYHVAALLEEPTFLEGRLAFEALEAAGKAAADDVAAHKQQAEAYRDYIELWIHEIKTPIAAAGLMAAGLHGPEASKLKGELDRIEGYVEQALYYARSTSLAQDFSIRPVSLALTAREVCKKHARYLVEQGVAPAFELDEGAQVFADGKWLAFVMGQVVANAAKYGAHTVRFSAREEGEGAAGRTVLEIADDGCGIPAADVPRVFDRGFTGENGRRTGSSTGMGLYLAALMCERMGLGIAVASEEGAGTRVLLTFPHDRRRMDSSSLSNT
ncbi:sensor histidine kinase [Arabiibacter massiliensis]|uniref:sensor histidine kinase n=1 Tax=Arabiibacter massiliensis TaxID=1870985 RepID=UPI0009B97014|nr:sensor histidine kinase [Arabiibacter massiliensis]